MEEKIIIDGSEEILGRVASFAAKKALQGKQVVIVNCNKIFISGNRSNILENYRILRKRKNTHFPSIPERIMKRTIRGMIKYKSGRGAIAFKRIMCYNLVPAGLDTEKAIKLGNKNKNLTSLQELARSLKTGRIR